MSDFLINTPNHKRWYLPNRDFAINEFIYDDAITMSVIRLRDSRTMERTTIKLDKEGQWETLEELFQKLAMKKYPKPLRHKDQERREELFRSRYNDSRF